MIFLKALYFWPFATMHRINKAAAMRRFKTGAKAIRINAFIRGYLALWNGRKGPDTLEQQVWFSLQTGALNLEGNEELETCYRHLVSQGVGISLGDVLVGRIDSSDPSYDWFPFLKYLHDSGWKPGLSLAAERLEMRNGGKWRTGWNQSA